MNVKVLALVAAVLSVAALPTAADARCQGCGVAAGVVGGLALGAIIGSSVANAEPRYYEERPVYVAPPRRAYYGGPAYVEGPVCHVERQRFWDGYGWRSRRVEVCD
jgi:hypothetical protein